MDNNKFSEKRMSILENKEQDFLLETLQVLEEASALEKTGKECDAQALIDALIEKGQANLEQLENNRFPNIEMPVVIPDIPSPGDILAEDDMVVLKMFHAEEFNSYMEVLFARNTAKAIYKDEQFRLRFWEEFLKDYFVTASIYDKESQKFVGYCSINDIREDDWEIAIELKTEYRQQGYGYRALNLFIKKLTELTGHRFYRACIDLDNHASQKLFKKIGAYPDGIGEYLLHGDDLAKFQKENMKSITDDIRAVAEEFCMEPEDILGYVLRYRIDAQSSSSN